MGRVYVAKLISTVWRGFDPPWELNICVWDFWLRFRLQSDHSTSENAIAFVSSIDAKNYPHKSASVPTIWLCPFMLKAIQRKQSGSMSHPAIQVCEVRALLDEAIEGCVGFG